MNDPISKIQMWTSAGEPAVWIAATTFVAVCFLVFNALRILLYLPQLRTCWVDPNGCSSINLFTWCSWIVANASTSLYMWLFQHDLWGLILNAGNAAMCALIAGVAAVKKRQIVRHPGPWSAG